jgi:hypothetical protein
LGQEAGAAVTDAVLALGDRCLDVRHRAVVVAVVSVDLSDSALAACARSAGDGGADAVLLHADEESRLPAAVGAVRGTSMPVLVRSCAADVASACLDAGAVGILDPTGSPGEAGAALLAACTGAGATLLTPSEHAAARARELGAPRARIVLDADAELGAVAGLVSRGHTVALDVRSVPQAAVGIAAGARVLRTTGEVRAVRRTATVLAALLEARDR